MLKPLTNISRAIFERYAFQYSRTLSAFTEKALAIMSPELPPLSLDKIYICPLCTKNYMVLTPGGIYGNQDFSLDHLPPESVGGKDKLPTCKKCNNDAGYYEAELSKLLDLGIPDKKKQTILSKTRIIDTKSGRSFPVNLFKSGDTLDIQFIEAVKKHNEDTKMFLKELHAGQLSSLRVQTETPDLNKTATAILKSSYLLGFVWWGYDFVYSDHAQWIREVLRGERSYPVRIPATWSETNMQSISSGVSVLFHNGIKKAFIMCLELKTSNRQVMATTLFPNPTTEGWSMLSDLKPFIEGPSSTPIDCITIPQTIVQQGYRRGWDLVG